MVAGSSRVMPMPDMVMWRAYRRRSWGRIRTSRFIVVRGGTDYREEQHASDADKEMKAFPGVDFLSARGTNRTNGIVAAPR